MGITKADITKKCIEELKKFGWSIKENYSINIENSETVEVDIALIGEIKTNVDIDIGKLKVEYSLNSKEICGYVLILHPENKKDIAEIKRKLQCLLSFVKPKVLFVTDGSIYETYFYGEYYDTLLVPLKAQNIDQAIRLLSYYKMIRDLRKDK